MINRRVILIFVINILIYIYGINAIGDTIILKNGDSLNGKLISLSGKVVTFKTDYAGTLFIKQKKVKNVATESDFTIIYSDGSEEVRHLTKELEIDKIEIIRSSTSSLIVLTSAWNSQLTVALAGTAGNNQSQNFSMFGESSLLRTKSEQLINFAQTRESTDQLRTTDLIDLKYNYRWLRENRWYSNLNIDYSYEPMNDVAWRAVLGFGGGKKFIEHSLTDLSLDIAVSAVYQSLENLEEVLPAVRVASVFRKKLFGGRIELLQQNRILWISETGSGVMDGLFGLRIVLSNSLNLDFRANVKHETEPVESAKKNDLNYSVGIGVSF